MSINRFWTDQRLRDLRQLHLAGRWDQNAFCKDCDMWGYSDNYFLPNVLGSASADGSRARSGGDRSRRRGQGEEDAVVSGLPAVSFDPGQDAGAACRYSRGPRGLVLAVTGMGLAKAGAAMRELLPRVRPRAVVTLGFAGATDRSLKSGEIILVRETGTEGATGPRYASDAGLLGAAARSLTTAGVLYRTGTLVSVSRPLCRGAEKLEFGERRGCLASTWKRRPSPRSATRGRPFLAVRVVLDEALDELRLAPAALFREGRFSAVKTAGLLLRRPGLLPACLRLRQLRLAATRSLRTIAGPVLEGIGG